MSANSAILLLPRPQVAAAETLFTPYMGFVEAFRALCRPGREKRGLELYDVSHYARRSESALSKWETGETIQPDNLDQLLDGYAQAFGMATTELIELITQKMQADDPLEERDDDPATTSLDEIEPEETDRDTENDEEAEEGTG